MNEYESDIYKQESSINTDGSSIDKPIPDTHGVSYIPDESNNFYRSTRYKVVSNLAELNDNTEYTENRKQMRTTHRKFQTQVFGIKSVYIPLQ